MTHANFDEIQAKLLEAVVAMAATKGKEYANNDSDRLDNFKRTAKSLGLSPEQICWVYTKKHIDAIESYCRTDIAYSEETIEGRIIDVITYLTLLWGIIVERHDEAYAINEQKIIQESRNVQRL